MYCSFLLYVYNSAEFCTKILFFILEAISMTMIFTILNRMLPDRNWLLAILFLFVFFGIILPPKIYPESFGYTMNRIVEVDVYIDPTDYFYYYYSFNYLNRALKLDGLERKIQSLSMLEVEPNIDNYYHDQKPKIYLVIIYQHNLDKYQEMLELINFREHLVLWIISPEGEKLVNPTDFNLDGMSSASIVDSFHQEFRSYILPRIFTLYTNRDRV